MRKQHYIIGIILISTIVLALSAFANKDENILDKIFSKDIENITFEEQQIIMQNNESDMDLLIETINNGILFFEESINNNSTISDEIRNLQKQKLEELKILLLNVEKKEKSYEEYFSVYETERLNYIEKYRELRDGQS